MKASNLAEHMKNDSPTVILSHETQQERNSFSNTMGLRTTFIAEEREVEIENCYITKSPYISSIKAKIGENEVQKL